MKELINFDQLYSEFQKYYKYELCIFYIEFLNLSYFLVK